MENKTETLSDNRGIYFELIPGVVKDNDDPLFLGRIKVNFENNPNISSGWIRPTLPGVGYEHGIWIIPSIGDYVLCMLKQGHPDFGFWIGGFTDTRQYETKGKGASGEPNQSGVANDEDSKSEKYDFAKNQRYEKGGKVHENIIIKHRNGSKAILYENGSILVENKSVTHWITDEGVIQTTSMTPKDDGTYYIEEDGIKKGYMRKVDTDGSITEFNPSSRYSVDADGNINWKTNGNVDSVIQGNVTNDYKGDYSKIIKGKSVTTVEGNVTMNHKGKVTWKVDGDLEIEVKGTFKVKASAVDVKGQTLEMMGSKMAKYEGGIQAVVKSPLTLIN